MRRLRPSELIESGDVASTGVGGVKMGSCWFGKPARSYNSIAATLRVYRPGPTVRKVGDYYVRVGSGRVEVKGMASGPTLHVFTEQDADRVVEAIETGEVAPDPLLAEKVARMKARLAKLEVRLANSRRLVVETRVVRDIVRGSSASVGCTTVTLRLAKQIQSELKGDKKKQCKR